VPLRARYLLEEKFYGIVPVISNANLPGEKQCRRQDATFPSKPSCTMRFFRKPSYSDLSLNGLTRWYGVPIFEVDDQAEAEIVAGAVRFEVVP